MMGSGNSIAMRALALLGTSMLVSSALPYTALADVIVPDLVDKIDVNEQDAREIAAEEAENSGGISNRFDTNDSGWDQHIDRNGQDAGPAPEENENDKVQEPEGDTDRPEGGGADGEGKAPEGGNGGKQAEGGTEGTGDEKGTEGTGNEKGAGRAGDEKDDGKGELSKVFQGAKEVKVIGEFGGVFKDTLNNEILDGWVRSDGRWYFFENGKMHEGQMEKYGVSFYFTPKRLATDANPAGAAWSGWKNEFGWYYYEPRNEGWPPSLKKGWTYASSPDNANNGEKYWYYLGEDGKMATGWQQLGGSWFYLATQKDIDEGKTDQPLGSMLHGKLEWGGNTYWLNDMPGTAYGEMATGILNVDLGDGKGKVDHYFNIHEKPEGALNDESESFVKTSAGSSGGGSYVAPSSSDEGSAQSWSNDSSSVTESEGYASPAQSEPEQTNANNSSSRTGREIWVEDRGTVTYDDLWSLMNN